jgi:hypothetical protein
MAEIGPNWNSGGWADNGSGTGGWDPNSQINGPLSKLYKANEYDFQSRFYPRNLASDIRGHYINFYINTAHNSMYNEGNKYKFVNTNGKTATNQRNGSTITATNLNEVINGGIAGVNKLTSLYPDYTPISPISNVTFGKNITLARKTKRITQAIALYMPETMNIQYNSNWESAELTEAGGKLLFMGQAGKGLYDNLSKGDGSPQGAATATIKNLATDSSMQSFAAELLGEAGTKSGLLGNGASDFLLQATGRALNPQLEVLFKGTAMRTFQFEFMFAPFDADEAGNVLEIIKTFKFHMAPEINTSAMGRYFTPPSEFDIDFLQGGQINPNVHQVGTCVLTDLNVDYAPNGWSTFQNGMPTHIRMTLQFMETEIITKKRIEEGY